MIDMTPPLSNPTKTISLKNALFISVPISNGIAIVSQLSTTDSSVSRLDLLSVPYYINSEEIIIDGILAGYILSELEISRSDINSVIDTFNRMPFSEFDYRTKFHHYLTELGNINHPIIRAVVAAFEKDANKRYNCVHHDLIYNTYNWKREVPEVNRKDRISEALNYFKIDNMDTAIYIYDSIYAQAEEEDPLNIETKTVNELIEQIIKDKK